MVIYKHKIPIKDRFSLDLPKGAEIISFQTQHDIPNIWTLQDNDNPLETRSFLLVGTGQTIPKLEFEYIGTIQLLQGALVYHLFEIF